MILELKKKIQKLEKNKEKLIKKVFDFKNNKRILGTKENEINTLKENIKSINQKINETNNKKIKTLEDKKIKTNEINIIPSNSTKDNFDSKGINIFGKLKKKIKLLEPLFNLLFMNNINNKIQKNFEINKLIEGEIIKKINNNDLPQIILIKENSSNFLNFDIINKYINSNEEEKNKLLKGNQEEFYNINKKLKNTYSNSQELSIIQNYNDAINNMNNKYYIINKNICKDIIKNIKDTHNYYFISNDKEYIFFEKEKKILQLKADSDSKKNGLCLLINYVMEIKECLELINSQIVFNKDINNINIYTDIKYNYINKYYLMNKNWNRIKIDKENKNKYSITNNKNIPVVDEKPEIKTTNFDYLNYPIDFEFIDKEYYESIINILGSKDKIINIDKFLISKMFFVNWQNYIPEEQLTSFNNNIYIGLIDDNNSVIYFYLINNKEYLFKFILQFNDKNIMYEEINNIKREGVGQYISEVGVDFSKVKVEESFDLIKYDLKSIGMFINFNNKYVNKINIPKISKCLQYIEDLYFYNGVLQCLSNIQKIGSFFLNRNNLIKVIEENSIFTKYFYEIIQDLWHWNAENKSNNININFIKEIKKSVKFKNNNYDNVTLIIILYKL